MCGIAGVASRQKLNPQTLAAAVERLRHRGPDDAGIYIDSDRMVGLGHTRLAIIDLSSGGHQPMQSADGRVTLTFNGEIYNFVQLREELSAQGHRFTGKSDTEVLLAGYLAYGTNILDRLNGIFAFAIDDARNDQLFVARDQLGVKPLYFSESRLGVSFASEIKALLELLPIDRTLDVAAIRRYLTFLWCPGEQTPFQHVKKLAPGSAMIIRNGEIARRWTYWQPPLYAPRSDWSAADCAAELHELLGACVRRQMVSDAPLGAFLSGGIDSSSVVAAASRSNADIKCFTIELVGGPETGTGDDLRFARMVAADLGVSLRSVPVDARMMCEKAASMIEILDEPLADPACLNLLFISELARSEGIKVLLSGAGGDDLFAGYRRHALLSLDPLWSAIPGSVRRGLASLASHADCRRGWQRRLAQFLEVVAEDGNRRISSCLSWAPAREAGNLLSSDAMVSLAGDDVDAPLVASIASAPADLPAVEKCLTLEKRFFLADHNLMYTDKMAMAVGVEVRVPLLDLDLIGFAAKVPVVWKHRFMTPKWILKRAQEKTLPREVIRRRKTGFGAPLRRWMKGEMQELVLDLLSDETIKRRGLFDAAALQKLLDEDRRGKTDASYTLFSAMCIELWCRRFVDEPVVAAPASTQHAETPARDHSLRCQQ